MDFFSHQEAARRNTGVLVFYFIVAVILIVLAIYIAAALVLPLALEQSAQRPLSERLWNPVVFAWSATATLGLVLLGSLYKTFALRRGGQTIAEALGGVPVNTATRDPAQRRLLNVVEEMAIASGTPVPSLYLLPKEAGINAFAAGHTPADAVIAVTRGCLETLSRDELQGVIAHEFSHILNGDMRLNLRLMGILHGILLIGLAGRGLLRSFGRSRSRSSRSNSNKGAAGIILFALALLLIGYMGVFFGNLIKAAVSRQREFLADASAVQFTRNPQGIGGALKKIGGLAAGSRLAAPTAEIASHLYFADGLAEQFTRLLATHPPLEERIRRIDPAFDGRFTQVSVPFAAPAAAAFSPATQTSIKPSEAVARAGAPRPEHLAFAFDLSARIPPALDTAAHEPFGARAVIYGLLLSRTPELRRSQYAWLKQHADAAVVRETAKLLPELEALPREAYLPLANLSLPALRDLSPDQYRSFRDKVEHLIRTDRRVTLFEFALQRSLLRHLDGYFHRRKPPVIQYYALHRLNSECGILLSALAYAGQTDPEKAAAAFAAGVSELNLKALPTLLPRDEIRLEQVDAALDRLSLVSPKLKRRLLAACTASVAADGMVTLGEAELLRAVADSLDVPLPPLLPGSIIRGQSATRVRSC